MKMVSAVSPTGTTWRQPIASYCARGLLSRLTKPMVSHRDPSAKSELLHPLVDDRLYFARRGVLSLYKDFVFITSTDASICDNGRERDCAASRVHFG